MQIGFPNPLERNDGDDSRRVSASDRGNGCRANSQWREETPVLLTLLGSGVLALRHCTVLFYLPVHGDRNELAPLHVLELHHGVTFPSGWAFGRSARWPVGIDANSDWNCLNMPQTVPRTTAGDGRH